MTIAEKSTEIGGGADLAEDFYQACTIVNEYSDDTNTTWECVKAKGILVAEEGVHNGWNGNNFYYCSKDHDETITSTSTDAEVKASIKAYVDGLEWTEKAVAKGTDSRSKV